MTVEKLKELNVKNAGTEYNGMMRGHDVHTKKKQEKEKKMKKF